MRGRLAATLLTGALTPAAVGVLAGCRDDPATPPAACFQPAAIRAALAEPAERRLADGTPISRCVALSTSDRSLQSLGLVLTDVAHELAERALGGDAAAAEQLGYLVGAVSRGSESGQGVQLELARRLESSARRVRGATMARALAGGVRSGERRG